MTPISTSILCRGSTCWYVCLVKSFCVHVCVWVCITYGKFWSNDIFPTGAIFKMFYCCTVVDFYITWIAEPVQKPEQSRQIQLACIVMPRKLLCNCSMRGRLRTRGGQHIASHDITFFINSADDTSDFCAEQLCLPLTWLYWGWVYWMILICRIQFCILLFGCLIILVAV